jgi:hypothetical protein
MMQSGSYFLSHLSSFLELDPTRIELLSFSLSDQVTAADKNPLSFILFSIVELDVDRDFLTKYTVSNPHKYLSVRSVVNRIADVAKESHPLLRKMGVRSVFLQYLNGEDEIAVNVAIKHSGFGGDGFKDDYLGPISSSNQYDDLLLAQSSTNDRFDYSLWSEFGVESDEESVDTISSHTVADPHEVDNPVDTPLETIHRDYVNILEYESKMRDLKIVNERLILAVRRLYSNKEVSAKVAQFWEGMFGNKRYKQLAEKELVQAMRCDPSNVSKKTGALSHLFPSIARRERIYQAMYSRSIDDLKEVMEDLKPLTGGYAYLYGGRLVNEIVSLKQQFENTKLLAKSFADLPIIEDFLLSCGRLSYSGKEMFEAMEIRQKLVSIGLQKGKITDIEIIKTRAILCNLIISRDMAKLKEKVIELQSREEMKSSISNEQNFAESLIQEYDLSTYNLQAAIDKKEVDLLDLALSIASYNNFFCKEVDQAVKTLDDISRNPAILIRPIVEGLRKSKMVLVDEGFENILKMGLKHEALDSVVCSKIHAIKARLMQVTLSKASIL